MVDNKSFEPLCEVFGVHNERHTIYNGEAVFTHPQLPPGEVLSVAFVTIAALNSDRLRHGDTPLLDRLVIHPKGNHYRGICETLMKIPLEDLLPHATKMENTEEVLATLRQRAVKL